MYTDLKNYLKSNLYFNIVNRISHMNEYTVKHKRNYFNNKAKIHDPCDLAGNKQTKFNWA